MLRGMTVMSHDASMVVLSRFHDILIQPLRLVALLSLKTENVKGHRRTGIREERVVPRLL